MKLNNFLFLLSISLLLTSCVSSKKYNELLLAKANSDKEFRKYKTGHKLTIEEQAALEKKLSQSELALSAMKAEKSTLQTAYDNLKGDNNSLKDRYDELLKNNEIQLGSASAEKQALTQQLAAKQKELDDKERKLNLLEANIKKAQEEINKSKEELKLAQGAISEKEKRVNELESLIKAQEDKVTALRNRLTNALLGFNESDLTIEQRNGKVYVSLSQNLLFASGSTRVDTKGRAALKTLAEVLNANTDIDIIVEGHTDNVPIKRGAITDNWDLSVLRSTSIVRELTKNNVDPKRISAAGRGEFFPKSDNSTREGRADNRRSDIILSPKLDELYNLIGNQ